MASIRERGNSYQITVSKGRDIHNKQILETTTWVPDPEKTDRQNEKALQKFALDFEEKVKNGKYLKGEKMTYQEYIPLWLEEYGQKQLESTSLELCTDVLNRVVFALDFEEKVKNGKYLKGEKMTYQEYIPLWLEEYGQKQLESTSLELCTDVLNRVVFARNRAPQTIRDTAPAFAAPLQQARKRGIYKKRPAQKLQPQHPEEISSDHKQYINGSSPMAAYRV